MIKWLIENKEWLFSGLGVSIIMIILTSIPKLIKKSEQTSSSINQVQKSGKDCANIQSLNNSTINIQIKNEK